MSGDINLAAVLIANMMGLMLSVLLLSSNAWRYNIRNTENLALLRMIVIGVVTSVCDVITFLADGQQGAFFRVIIYLSNTWLFLSNLLIGPAWVALISEHMHVPTGRVHKYIIEAICVIGAGSLVINLFYPFVFTVDSNNVYGRASFYWFFMVVEFFFIFDGLILYFVSFKKGSVVRFFPLWQFLVPVFIGIVIQTLLYGVSTIWPFFSIAICGLVLSLQNDSMFKDGLTGLYNKSYLDNLKNKITLSSNREKFTALMLDMNAFKQINDNFGHAEGDAALIIIADILSRTVGRSGIVVRYAGDEFVILLKTQEQDKIDGCIKSIKDGIDEFNRSGQKEYELSIAIGACAINLSEQSVDDVLNVVDSLMYSDKKNFYETHMQFDRRH